MLTLSLAGWGQLQFASNSAEVYFPPTTVDSTSTFPVVIINELSLPQTVSLAGLSAPFSSNLAEVLVPANDTTSIAISFTPDSVSAFADTLICTGNVFGTDTLYVFGEGTLPEVTVLEPTVDFGTVSINSIHTQTFQLVNSGVGSLVIGAPTSATAEFSGTGDIIIAEGDTASLEVAFDTELANLYSGSLTYPTSDPFTPTITIDLAAEAISEVSGTLCGNLSIINSPYVFTGDVLVPEECTLSIEPGVVVDLNGYILNVLGSLECHGTESERVTVQNGQVQLSQAEFNTEYTDYSNNASLNLVNRETVYFNDFEDGNQPFYCYSDNWGGNTSGNGNYGCDLFDNVQELTWSSNGLRSLRFYSEYRNGRLELAEDLTDLESGLYQWSFFYKQHTARRGIRLTAYYQINDGSWVQFYSTPEDSYNDASEQFSGFSGFIEIPEGGSTNIRFIHNTTSGSCEYFGRGFIDDLRLDKVTQLPTEAFIFNDQATLGGSSTSGSSGVAIAGASFAYGAVGTSLQLQTGIGQPVSYWISRPISIHSNRIFIDYWEQVTTADQNCWYYTHYRVNEDDWVLLREDQAIYCGDGSIGTHGWEQRQYIIENLEFGDQVEFRLRVEAYDIGNPIYRDVTIYVDEFRVREDFSQPVALKATNPGTITLDETTIQGDCLFIGDDLSLALKNSDVEGIYVEGGNANMVADTSVIHKVDMAYSECAIHLNESTISDETGNGVYMGSESEFTAFHSFVTECGGSAITVGPNSTVDLDYSFVTSNGGDGAELGLGSTISVNNSLIAYNLGYGINSAGSADIDYSVLRGNGKQGLLTSQFSTVDNSILWFNDGVPQMLTGNVYAVSYSNVQGINALLTSSSFAWGDGCIGTDPVFADSLSYLDPFSPCVDGGKPWEQDAHIPYGLGSSRADMGLYGGPSNAFWGGQAPPDGAVSVTEVFDIPEDEGGYVGIHFTASPFDFGGLGFNVTHYSIWRDLSLGEADTVDVGDGNWEQIGTVPAQGFGQYGFTAETLVDEMPGEEDCLMSFIVIAHTTDDNIYWVSDVVAGCSIDNLAPDAPELVGMPTENDSSGAAVILAWDPVEAEDYVSTRVFGVETSFEILIETGDTSVVDASVVAGSTYSYGSFHTDIHGNRSDTAYVDVLVPGGEDVVALSAGWNLIALDRHPEVFGVQAILSSLAPGNLRYATGFDEGAQFFDAQGPFFLNTLSTLEGGRGYWIKVDYPDTLTVPGVRVQEDELPSLVAGWNLAGYVEDLPADPSDHFSIDVGMELAYVTGFSPEDGVEVFNPNGLPWLNTLNALENSRGYWVKADMEGTGMLEEGEGAPNPAFMVLNGRANLSFGHLEILDDRGRMIGQAQVDEAGWIRTTVLYGGPFGISEGSLLTFRREGAVAAESIRFHGDMRHAKLDLQFESETAEWRCWPVPTADHIQWRGEVPAAGQLSGRLIDMAGRVVLDFSRNAEPGPITESIDLTSLSPGLYWIDLTLDGAPLHRQQIEKQ